MEAVWDNLKRPLLETAKEVCGVSSHRLWRKETWWWNESVNAAVNKKQALFRTYSTPRKQGNTPAAAKAIAEYDASKRQATTTT